MRSRKIETEMKNKQTVASAHVGVRSSSPIEVSSVAMIDSSRLYFVNISRLMENTKYSQEIAKTCSPICLMSTPLQYYNPAVLTK